MVRVGDQHRAEVLLDGERIDRTDGLERADDAGAIGWLGTAGLIFVAGLLVWHGARRFLHLLAEAEHLASQSTCESCRRYAAFNVISEYPQMSVRCRKCGNEWQLDS